MNRLRWLGGLIALLAASSTANAQRISQIGAGERVRVTLTHGSPIVGRFVGTQGDSVQLMPEGRSSTVKSTVASEITRIEVSGGRNRAKGALMKGLIGLGVGVVSGALLGAATYSDSRQEVCTPNLGCGPEWCVFICSKGQAAGLAGTLGGVAGVVIGTVVGAATGQESWSAAALPQKSATSALLEHDWRTPPNYLR